MLRRQCELAVGQMLISMKARGLLCGEGFRRKTPEGGRARLALRELGLCWPTAHGILKPNLNQSFQDHSLALAA